jgi:protein involved in polysaccharide export with SLBB domain
MRLLLPLAIALTLFSGCSSASRRASTPPPDSAALDTVKDVSSGASDPGSMEVVDPVAAPAGDHFATVPAANEPAERPNTLAPGFLIRLSHQEDKDLNGSFRIGFDGKIELPYNVTFRAQGLTLDEFRNKVLESYKPFYKGGLRLTVALEEKAYFVELRGLIKKPGRYKVHGDTSLDEVISLGEGFPSAAENQPRFLRISRGEASRMVNLEDYYKTGSLKSNTPWRGGEVLFFQKESMASDPNSMETGTAVQVLGELKKPGEFGHRPGADVYFYLAEAGGPTRDMDFDRVLIYRGAAGKRQVLEFPLDEPDKVPPVMPGDILVFRSDIPTKFQKTVTTAASIASIITAVALLIIAL